MTNEEWMTYKDGEMFVGLGVSLVTICRFVSAHLT